MDLNIKLEDERFCTGCPLESQHRLKCQGGFVREIAQLIEIDVQTFGGRTKTLMSQPIRPTSCLVANERVLVAIKRIPERPEDDAEDPDPIVLQPPPPPESPHD